jgi:hypothetical protein
MAVPAVSYSNLVYPSASSGFIPEATGQVIAFTIDPGEFKINSYVQNVKTPKPIGVYAVLDRDAPVRVVNDADFVWKDGDERPEGREQIGRFQERSFIATRRDYSFMLGETALETTDLYDLKATEQGNAASRAMVNRTNRVISMLETTGNWPSTNVATATALNGGRGNWATASNDISSGNYLAVQRTIYAALANILLQTNSKVKPKDMVLVLSPNAAVATANSSEIHDYISHSPAAIEQLTGKAAALNPNLAWGLPTNLYGIELVIEDCPRVTTRPDMSATGDQGSFVGGAGSRVFVKSDSTAFLISRKGGLKGIYGAKSFSTVQCYFWKYELAVEIFNDARNKRMDGHVVEYFAEVLAAPIAGMLITGIT